MRRLVVALALVAVAGRGVARAGERPAWVVGEPPIGWTELPGLSRSVATTLQQTWTFGGTSPSAGAQAFADPGTGAFYLSWLSAELPVPDPASFLRAAFDRVRASRADSSAEGSTEELRWHEAIDGGMAEVRLEWRHLSNETLTLARALGWVNTAGVPHLLKAECVIGTTGGAAPAAVESACRKALDAVRVAVGPGDRRPLTALPASAAGGGPPSADDGSNGAAAGPAPATLGPAPAGEQKVLYQGPPPAGEKDSLSRWFILAGAGLLVLAFYLTQRKRQRPAPGDPAGDDEEKS